MNIRYINRSTGEIETESPPAEGLLKLLYENAVGKSTILPIAKQKFVTELYGRRMDRPSSTKQIQEFVDSMGIDMSESKKSVEEFTSFNDFFYRKLVPEARPIGDGMVSPGDGRLLAFEHFSQVGEFYVKGRKFTLPEFLANSSLARTYEEASMIILRLAPNDYHRYHFPFEGIPSISKKIKGFYFSVSPYALASSLAKVFCENKREICTLNSQEKEMLIIPIGATMVGSIISTYTPGQMVPKGEEMGYFAFGGSTIVLLFHPNHFTIDQDLIQNTQKGMETFVKMGERIAEEVGG
ncbi:MAG: archaetidylserine decarboxylase [Bacteroidota bacterium]